MEEGILVDEVETTTIDGDVMTQLVYQKMEELMEQLREQPSSEARAVYITLYDLLWEAYQQSNEVVDIKDFEKYLKGTPGF